jgi:hypothetical protein
MSHYISDDRPLKPPAAWHKNPDCDLHRSLDLISTVDDTGDPHTIDVFPADDGLLEVAFDAGINGTGYESIIVSTEHRANQAARLFAQRFRGGSDD